MKTSDSNMPSLENLPPSLLYTTYQGKSAWDHEDSNINPIQEMIKVLHELRITCTMVKYAMTLDVYHVLLQNKFIMEDAFWQDLLFGERGQIIKGTNRLIIYLSDYLYFDFYPLEKKADSKLSKEDLKKLAEYFKLNKVIVISDLEDLKNQLTNLNDADNQN